MESKELRKWLKRNTDPHDQVELEVGGDGAFHSAPLRSIQRVDHQTVVLSSESA